MSVCVCVCPCFYFLFSLILSLSYFTIMVTTFFTSIKLHCSYLLYCYGNEIKSVLFFPPIKCSPFATRVSSLCLVWFPAFLYILVLLLLLLAFSKCARILGECWTIHSPNARFCFCFCFLVCVCVCVCVWRLAHVH